MSVMRKLPVVPICRRPSGLPKWPNQPHIAPVPCPREGRFAIVTSVGRGMRWTLPARATSAADADGQVVWSWRPWAGAKSRGDDSQGDGDYEVTDTGEEHEAAVNTNRAGNVDGVRRALLVILG